MSRGGVQGTASRPCRCPFHVVAPDVRGSGATTPTPRVILAAVIVATDVAGVQIPQMYLDLTAGE